MPLIGSPLDSVVMPRQVPPGPEWSRSTAHAVCGRRVGQRFGAVLCCLLCRIEARRERPEHPPAEDDEQCRQERGHRYECGSDANGSDRAEAAGRVEVGCEQASIPSRPWPADGGRGTHCGAPHRDVPILVTMQLLAIARDEEECVVRTDAEDQHREDADALRIDHQSDAIGEQPDDGVGQHIGKPNDEQREQPEHGTAVRQQQDHGDDNDGRDEQGRLDTVER